MDRPSQWPWPLKLLAVVLYGGAMAAIGWLLHRIVYDVMPDSAIRPALLLLFAGLGALALYGYLRDRRRRPPRQ